VKGKHLSILGDFWSLSNFSYLGNWQKPSWES